MSKVTTSLQIVFAVEGSSGEIKAEVDSRELGLNSGETQFYAGDSPGFLVFKEDGVGKLRLESSEGGIQSVTSGSIEVEEWLVFANSNSVGFQYPPNTGVALVEVNANNSASFRKSGAQLVSDKNTVAAVKVRYRTYFTGYRLTGASGKGPVVVFVQEVI